MGTPTDAPAPSRRRPPWWIVALVILLLAFGVGAPLGVTWYMHRTATLAPVDTTGNRPGARPAPDTSARDSAPGH